MSKKTTPPPNFEAWGELKLSCRKEGSGIGHIPVPFRHKKDIICCSVQGPKMRAEVYMCLWVVYFCCMKLCKLNPVHLKC